MARGIRELKGRMKAVGNIQRITKTMQMIATARFQKMQRRATEAQAYSRHIARVVGELAAALGADADVSHPLLKQPQPAAGKELLLVLTSDRGLCGSYNANVLRTLTAHLREHGGLKSNNIDVELVGRKGVAYCRFNHIELHRNLTQFGDAPSYEEVERLAEHYMQAYTSGGYDAIRVLYMHFETMSRQTPEVLQLLPLQPPKVAEDTKATGGATYEFSPDAQTLLDELLPITVKTRLFQCFNEAVVSEQLARMVAMKSATDAAGKQKKLLSRQYNRARQTAITTELTEIIGGAAALE